MSPEDAQDFEAFFSAVFRGFSGAMLFGGTRMILKSDLKTVVPGITEIPPMLATQNPLMKSIGVVARSQDLQYSDFGLVVSNEDDNDFVTICHPQQTAALLVQQSVDHESPWDAEYLECMELVHLLRTYSGFESLLFVYNGGGITEKEILRTADLGWPTLLVNGSGRKADEYATNKEFLLRYPHVMVAEKTVLSVRNQLIRARIIDDDLIDESDRPKLSLVG